MKIALVVAGIVVLAMVVGIVWIGMPRGPSLQEVAPLREPRILDMGWQKVLLVRGKGDPNQVARKAFGLLMRTYFGLENVPKGGPSFKAPRARWPVGENAPMEEWEGLYAMPVPDHVSRVPDRSSHPDLRVELATWEYGTVAQILHVGRYDSEEPTVQRLEAFIREEGYRIDGPHEEEYLKGPGLLFPGNPDNYLTLIRYRVAPISREGGAGP